MSMNGPGMWMPKQKSGKNWSVAYRFVYTDGDVQEGVKKFRIQADAYEWKKEMHNTAFYTKAFVGKVKSLDFGPVTKIE